MLLHNFCYIKRRDILNTSFGEKHPYLTKTKLFLLLFSIYVKWISYRLKIMANVKELLLLLL